MEKLDTRKLREKRDSEENTILHLAAAGKLTAMLNYILKGETALDLVVNDTSNSAVLKILPILVEAGASDQMPAPCSSDIREVIDPNNGRKTNKAYSPWEKPSTPIDSSVIIHSRSRQTEKDRKHKPSSSN
ncbi:hypothetical protein QQ045_028546 [Rhodiola kirilowii]